VGPTTGATQRVTAAGRGLQWVSFTATSLPGELRLREVSPLEPFRPRYGGNTYDTYDEWLLASLHDAQGHPAVGVPIQYLAEHETGGPVVVNTGWDGVARYRFWVNYPRPLYTRPPDPAASFEGQSVTFEMLTAVVFTGGATLVDWRDPLIYFDDESLRIAPYVPAGQTPPAEWGVSIWIGDPPSDAIGGVGSSGDTLVFPLAGLAGRQTLTSCVTGPWEPEGCGAFAYILVEVRNPEGAARTRSP
jgi:hypothetical protein